MIPKLHFEPWDPKYWYHATLNNEINYSYSGIILQTTTVTQIITKERRTEIASRVMILYNYSGIIRNI